MPGEPVGGTSCEPVSVAVNAIWSAFAIADNIKTASTTPTSFTVLFINTSLYRTERVDWAPHSTHSPTLLLQVDTFSQTRDTGSIENKQHIDPRNCLCRQLR